MSDANSDDLPRQTTHGSYSPIIKDVNGNVTIEYKGEDPRIVARLNELLDQKDKELGEARWTIEKKVQEANEWIKKYHELQASLANKGELSELDLQAKELFDIGEIEKAGALYDRYIEKQNEQIDKLASANYKRGRVYELLFQPLKAQPFYAKAYSLQPEKFEYAHDYATLLYNQKQYNQAEPIFLKNLKTLRNLAKYNPTVYQPDIAMTLNNLGLLYVDTQDHDRAQQALYDTLEIYRILAKANPSGYQSYVAGTLTNLGVFCAKTQNHDESETAFNESLEIYRKLAETNPSDYQPYVAKNLNNLGTLYGDTKRYDDAEQPLKEALGISHRLAKSNPTAYKPDVAMTLHNLGSLYKNTKKYDRAGQFYKEALEIRRQFWIKNPAAYGDGLSKTLIGLALVLFEKPGANKDSCDLLREAERAAYREDLKNIAQKFLQENC